LGSTSREGEASTGLGWVGLRGKVMVIEREGRKIDDIQISSHVITFQSISCHDVFLHCIGIRRLKSGLDGIGWDWIGLGIG